MPENVLTICNVRDGQFLKAVEVTHAVLFTTIPKNDSVIRRILLSALDVPTLVILAKFVQYKNELHKKITFICDANFRLSWRKSIALHNSVYF